MFNIKKVTIVLLILSSLAQADMFLQGSKSIGVKLGSASIGNEDYTIVGVSGNYFVADALSVGLGYETWLSGNPDIDKITAESTYFIQASDTVRPYAGVLYRRILINGTDRFGRSFDDINSYGTRVGVGFVQDNLLLSAGLVHEKYDSTQRFFDSSETYVEVTIGIVF